MSGIYCKDAMSPSMKHIPYARQWIDRRDEDEVIGALRSDFLTQGTRVGEFERAVASYCDARYAVAVNSGTSALHIAARASGLGARDEGITSPITFVASANCLLYCGARPVFADIETETGCVDPAAVSDAVTSRTRAIIPVHYAGLPCDMKELSKIAKRKKIIIIEDACHALGAVYRNSKIGSCRYSDMTVFSFHPVKHITTGEGGMVLTNDKKLYERLLILRSHGITKDPALMRQRHGPWYYEMIDLGHNYRITDLQCALGMSQLRRSFRFLERRRMIAKTYSKLLSGCAGIELPEEPAERRSAWHLYCVRTRGGSAVRKRLVEHLHRRGIGAQVHYIPVYWQPYYRKLGYKRGICPRAEAFYGQEISLPLYPLLRDKDVRYVADSVISFFDRIGRERCA